MSDQKPIVTIVNGRYRYKGAFHEPVPGTPIMDEAGKLWGVTNPRTMTYVHSLGAEGQFFQALTKGRLLATVCKNTDCEGVGTKYLPFRIFCPDCLEKNEVIDITEEAQKGAEIYTYIVTERTGAFNTLEKPIRFIDVTIPGVGTMIKSYMSGPGTPDIGVRVVPIFKTKNPTYTITDLSWASDQAKEEDLPEGFTFALPL